MPLTARLRDEENERINDILKRLMEKASDVYNYIQTESKTFSMGINSKINSIQKPI